MWEDMAWDTCYYEQSAREVSRIKELQMENDLRKKELETISTWMCTQLHDEASSIGCNEVISLENQQLRATLTELWNTMSVDSRKAFDPIMVETVLTGTKHHQNVEAENFLVQEVKSMHAELLSSVCMNNSGHLARWNKRHFLQTEEILEREVKGMCANMGIEDAERVRGAKAQLQDTCKQVKQIQAEYELMASGLAKESKDVQLLAAENSRLCVELVQLFNEGGQEEAPQEMMKLFTELRDVACDLQVSKLQAPDATPTADNLSQTQFEGTLNQTNLQLRDLVNYLRESPLSQPLLKNSLGTWVANQSHNEGLDMKGLASTVEHCQRDVLQRVDLQEKEVEHVRMHLRSLQKLFTSKRDFEECQNQLHLEGASPAQAELLMKLKVESQQKKHMVQELAAQVMNLSEQVEQNLCDVCSASKNVASGMAAICNEVKFWSCIEDDVADDEMLPQTEAGDCFSEKPGEEASTENITEDDEFLEKCVTAMQNMRSQLRKAMLPGMATTEKPESFLGEVDSDASSTCPGDDRLTASRFSSVGGKSFT